MIRSTPIRLTALLIAIAVGPAAGFGADLPTGQTGNPYNDVEQTVHNLMPPSSIYTIKELCVSCHVDGNIHVPGLPLPPEEASLPAFAAEREQRPLWNRNTPLKNYALSQNWPLPQPMSTDWPFGTSADCLGCHDGAFAQDVHRGGERRDKGGSKEIGHFIDWLEKALGGNDLVPRSEVPDHPISTFYPRKPNGDMVPKEPRTSLLRYFAIPDLQDEQMVLPTPASTSRFYAETPGNLRPPPSLGNGSGSGIALPPGGGISVAAIPTATAVEGPEQFRLVHTTFGVIHCDSCHNAHSELHNGFLRDKSPQLCLLCHDR